MSDAPNVGDTKDVIVGPRSEDEEPDGFRELYVAAFPVVVRTVFLIVQGRRLAEEIT